eukprot:NODE_1806_length_1294_cov_6.412048_g161_i1.p1 GENE.NODE_1806_length_1294_cov_6.412048_g161_i1~~NODE_1806_length_1294_cov_6.412048_g161_i1.p1  ORF type:complete len:284 (-),score=12.63 NODE_1806_length_1294_cov_6.412048_g161_i1:67-918(-)
MCPGQRTAEVPRLRFGAPSTSLLGAEATTPFVVSRLENAGQPHSVPLHPLHICSESSQAAGSVTQVGTSCGGSQRRGCSVASPAAPGKACRSSASPKSDPVPTLSTSSATRDPVDRQRPAAFRAALHIIVTQFGVPDPSQTLFVIRLARGKRKQGASGVAPEIFLSCPRQMTPVFRQSLHHLLSLPENQKLSLLKDLENFIKSQGFTGYSVRRGRAQELSDRGVSRKTIGQILGHTNDLELGVAHAYTEGLPLDVRSKLAATTPWSPAELPRLTGLAPSKPLV